MYSLTLNEKNLYIYLSHRHFLHLELKYTQLYIIELDNFKFNRTISFKHSDKLLSF